MRKSWISKRAERAAWTARLLAGMQVSPSLCSATPSYVQPPAGATLQPVSDAGRSTSSPVESPKWV